MKNLVETLVYIDIPNEERVEYPALVDLNDLCNGFAQPRVSIRAAIEIKEKFSDGVSEVMIFIGDKIRVSSPSNGFKSFNIIPDSLGLYNFGGMGWVWECKELFE